MGLKLWMPLTEDMRNLGLYGTNPGANGGIFENNGKLGKCLKTSGAIDTGLPYTEWNYSTDSITMCCWVKFNLAELRAALPSSIVTSSTTTPTGSLLGYNSYGGLALVWLVNNVYSNGLVNNIYLTGCYRTGGDLRATSSYTVPFDTWIHVVLVFDKSIKKILLYINGSAYGSAGLLPDSTPTVQQNFGINTIAVYRGNGPGRSIPCRINDVRVYNLALTLQEIKEISKGLVAHYTLGSASLASSGNLINGLAGGGLCTVSGNSINVSGTTSDTYFYIKTTKAMTSGKLYRLSCIGSGFPETALYNFPIAGQSNTGPGLIRIKNGPCVLTFVANDACANAGTNIIMDDTSRTAGAGTISGLCLEEINSVSDSSGYSRNLTITGNVSPADSVRYDKGIYMPNQNIDSNYLISGSDWSPSFITTGSISFWCKFNGLGSSGWLPFTGLSGSYYIMAWNNGGNFYHENIGSLTKTIYRDGVVVTAPTDNGNWHHYVITGTDLSTWTTFKINQYGNSWNSNMYISDLRLYNTILSANDVKDLYSLGATIS